MNKLLLRLSFVLITPFMIAALYLSAALIGGLIPGSFNKIDKQKTELEKPVYLIANLLHTDIAIPLNRLSLNEFAFLREAGFPLDNPNLEYLVIGWGAREFYTSTAEYSDIEFKTAWKAITGDRSVIHVAPSAELSGNELIELNMPNKNFVNLLAFIKQSFSMVHGKPIPLNNKTFGFGDVFYEAKGNFNILNPCNQWVSNAIAKAGFGTGYWTPTAYSFELGRSLYN